MIPDATIWNAVAEVMAKNPVPLEISRVADACKMDGVDVIAALIREARYPRYIQFRYAAHNQAATSIHNPVAAD